MSCLLGLITDRPGERVREELSLMIGSVLHEPFYKYRTCSIPEMGCHLAWVSHDDSFRDCEAIIRDDLVLVFAGENFPRSGTWDAEAFLRAYDLQGERCFRDLNGWFAGVLVDRRSQKIVLFNDGMMRRSITPLLAPQLAGRILAERDGREVLFSIRNVSDVMQLNTSVTVTK
jgi:hypothetical protein